MRKIKIKQIGRFDAQGIVMEKVGREILIKEGKRVELKNNQIKIKNV